MTNPLSLISLKNPWHLLATGFGSGLSPVVPGTMGTLAAVPFFVVGAAAISGLCRCGITFVRDWHQNLSSHVR